MVKSGCKFFRDCFECPYSDCIGGLSTDSLDTMKKRKQVKEMAEKGLSARAISEETGIHIRSVYRYLTDKLDIPHILV